MTVQNGQRMGGRGGTADGWMRRDGATEGLLKVMIFREI